MEQCFLSQSVPSSALGLSWWQGLSPFHTAPEGAEPGLCWAHCRTGQPGDPKTSKAWCESGGVGLLGTAIPGCLPQESQKGGWDQILQAFIFTLHSVVDKVMGIVQPEPLNAYHCQY